jgi:hypothetical protein
MRFQLSELKFSQVKLLTFLYPNTKFPNGLCGGVHMYVGWQYSGNIALCAVRHRLPGEVALSLKYRTIRFGHIRGNARNVDVDSFHRPDQGV